MELASFNATFILSITVGVLALFTLILLFAVFSLRKKVTRLLKGKDARTLEDTIRSLQDDVASLADAHAQTRTSISHIDNRLRRSIQGIDVLRFSPFNEGGGQSFASAFLDEYGDGLVISTLHARERVSVFAKPIAAYASEYELSDEEKQAIDRARQRIDG